MILRSLVGSHVPSFSKIGRGEPHTLSRGSAAGGGPSADPVHTALKWVHSETLPFQDPLEQQSGDKGLSSSRSWGWEMAGSRSGGWECETGGSRGGSRKLSLTEMAPGESSTSHSCSAASLALACIPHCHLGTYLTPECVAMS